MLLDLTRRRALSLLAPLTAAIRALAVQAGEPMPHFVARTMDGERITSDSIKGKILLIEFCGNLVPSLQERSAHS